MGHLYALSRLTHYSRVDWSNCGRVFGGNFGFFDPPVPVAPCTVGDCANQGADNIGLRPSPSTTPAAALGTPVNKPGYAIEPSPIASPAQALPAPGPTITPNPITPQNPGSRPDVNSNPNFPAPQNDPALNNLPSKPVTIVIPLDNSYATDPAQPQAPAIPSMPLAGASNSAPNNQNPPLPTPPPKPILLATLGNGNVVSANQGASSILVGSEVISAGGPAITIQNVGVVSLLPPGGGMVVKNNEAVTTYAYENNAATAESSKAVPIATLEGGSVISAIPGASNLVIGTQTLSLRGPAITVPGQGVMSLSPTGLVVLNDGKSSTYTISTSGPNPGNPASLLTLPSGQVITAIPGASSLVIGTQTLIVNGPPITVPGQGVMSLSPSDLVIVQNSVPTINPGNSESILTLASSQIVTAKLGASTLVVGTQTLTVDGPALTIPGQGIMSLSPTGLVIINNGIITTLSLPQSNPIYPSTLQIVSMNSGDLLTVSPLGSLVVIGSKTLTQGGSIATLSGDKVVSLGSSGVVLQLPGGKVTTIPVGGAVSKPMLSPSASALNLSTTGFGTSTKTSVVGGGETATVGVLATSSSVGENINNVISAKKGGSASLGAKMWSSLGLGLSVVVVLFF